MRQERVGVILVHGIGEQRRFEHLDSEIRPLIDAMKRRSGSAHVTVEIFAGTASTLHADQDTWSVQHGAPVCVIVCDGDVETRVYFHEVWWADVNEPYSLWKQIKFWCWGLSLWAAPEKLDSDLSGMEVMALPTFPGVIGNRGMRRGLRFQLFLASNVFAMAAFSLGAVVFFAKRLLGFQAPSVVRIFVNYIGAVKLYSQYKRSDGGFLDAYAEPPRVSIRRRMVRTLTDVAFANYDRWYIFAHSLGSVVAYNGIMENARALPNYLGEERYQELAAKRRFAGPARKAKKGHAREFVGNATRKMVPTRPSWLEPHDVVYRDKLFAKFRGLLTYGAPLDKFAAIWPARVPINIKEPAFHVNGKNKDLKPEWVNIFDPTDPVSAKLDAFDGPEKAPDGSVLKPVNYGYAASWWFLYSHLRYLKGKEKQNDCLSDRLAEWVLSGKQFSKPNRTPYWRWFEPYSLPYWIRLIAAVLMWLALYAVLTVVGALSIPLWESLIVEGGGIVLKKIGEIWRDWFAIAAGAPTAPNLASSLAAFYQNWFAGWCDPVLSRWQSFDTFLDALSRSLHLPKFMLKLPVYVALVTFATGLIGRLFFFKRDDDYKPAPTLVDNAVSRVAGTFRRGTSRNTASPS